MYRLSFGTLQLPFAIPGERCCNCAATAGVEQVRTEFKQTRLYPGLGTELTLALPLPYCQGCKVTAERRRLNLPRQLLAAFAVFWVVLVAEMLLVDGLLLPWLPWDWETTLAALPWLAAPIAWGIVRLYLGRQRPRPGQSSYHQPVYMRRLRRSFLGQFRSITLHCTHPEFARALAEANPGAIAAGQLVVQGG